MYFKAYVNNLHHPDIAATYNNLGGIYDARGEHELAIKHFQQALDIFCLTYRNSPNHPYIGISYNNLGNVYSKKGEYDQAINYYQQALDLYLGAYRHNPNHPYIATIYNNLGNIHRDKEEYEAAIKHLQQALTIQLIVYEQNPNHPSIAMNYNNLGITYFTKGDFEEAYFYTSKAVEIYSVLSHPDIKNSKLGCIYSLIQLGNLKLLHEDEEIARNYYEQASPSSKQVNLKSIEFIQLICSSRDSAYVGAALPAAINCQKVLLRVDPELVYGNHYHNLACFYSCQVNIKKANKVFIKALIHPRAQVTGELHAEYAQFLIVNKSSDVLKADSHEITKHLYFAISSSAPGSLQYGKIEQGTVCSILSNLIKEKNGTININPKVLAYYLLTTHLEYIREGDNIEILLESFKCYCKDQQDEIAFRLLSDAYKGNHYEEAAIKYFNCANVIDQVDKVISGKLKLDSDKYTITLPEIEDYALALNKVALVTVSESRLNDVLKFYTKLFKIYNSVLTDQPKQLQLATNNLATFSLLTNNVEQYIGLKFKFGAELQHDLINVLGQNVEQIVMIEQHIMAQIQPQAQIAMQPHRTNESTVIRENTESEVSPLGENEEFS